MPPPVAETFADLDYPVNGVDMAAGYSDQRPGTTRVGVNVRACEPLTQRMRGGQRPGLSAYLPQLPSGAHMIQHLGVVVDPSGDALPWNFSYPNLDLFDPSSPGLPGDWGPGNASRIANLGGDPSAIPTGGWMYQPNKNTPAPKSGPRAAIAFVQQNNTFFNSGTIGSQGVAYPHNVASGNTLLVAQTVRDPADNPPNTPTDTQGNSYTLIGSATTQTSQFAVDVNGLYVWIAQANSSGANTVTFSIGGTGFWNRVGVGVLEYSGVSSVQPLDGSYVTSRVSYPDAGVTSLTTGTLTPTANGDGAVGFFFVEDSVSAASGSTRRLTPIYLSVLDVLGLGLSGTSVNCTAPGTNRYAALGILLRQR